MQTLGLLLDALNMGHATGCLFLGLTSASLEFRSALCLIPINTSMRFAPHTMNAREGASVIEARLQ